MRPRPATAVASVLWLLSLSAGAGRAIAAGEAAADAENGRGLHAGQIDAENVAAYRVGGPDAIGGIGDWAIGNGTLCAVISDREHEAILSEVGGVLIDLGHCDREDDQFNVLHSLMNMSRSEVVPVRSVRAELDLYTAEARIITTGERLGVFVETTYSLRRDRPSALGIVTRLVRRKPGERLFLFGDVSLHGHRQLSGFALAAKRLEHSTGFGHSSLDPFKPLEMLSAVVPADTQVMVGGDALSPGIAYGLQLVEVTLERASGEVLTVPSLTVNGENFSMLGVFARPFWVGGEDSLGLLPLAQTLMMDLHKGDSLVIRRLMHVGDRADVASVTDQIFSDAPRVHGSVNDPSARLHVSLAAGAPVTQVRPDPDGAFSFRVPTGRYQLVVIAPGNRSVQRDLEVGETDVDLGKIDVGAAARVTLPRGQRMRLVFAGAGRTADPRFGDDLLGFRIGDEEIPSSAQANHVSLAGIDADPAHVTLAPGRYDVYATRGLEYEVTHVSLEIAAGETKTLEIEAPPRALRTPHWISADLHVHSEWSDDSALPQDTRIATFVAQGAEVMVATEHDRVVDYGPRIRSLGLARQVVSVIGSEVTSTSHSEAAPHTFGHVNVFPLPYRPDQYRGGSPRGEGRRLRDLIADVRAQVGDRVVQLNHARATGDDSGDGQFFSHLSFGEPFDPTLPLDAPPNRTLVERASEQAPRDLDFDAMELMNGPSMQRYRRLRADWFSLLLQGEIRTATANSDSHRAGELVALPLNYVRLANDTVRGFRESAFVAAVRGGSSYGSTGPILDLRLVGKRTARIGQTYRGARASLHLSVKAASWIPISEARVYVNAELIYRGSLTAGERQELPLNFETDSFITVEVEGKPGDVYAAVAPGFVPFAFTNPIFVDADGDGEWTAPGLPEPLPDTIVAADPSTKAGGAPQ